MTKGNAIRCAAIFLCSVLFTGSLSAVPSGQQVQCDIRLGYGSGQITFAPNSSSLIPLIVTINNDVANTKGTIEVTRSLTGSHEVTETTPFTTPKNSLKRFTILTRHQSGAPTKVTVRFEKHITDVSRTIHQMRDANKPIVLCVGINEGSDLRKRIRKPYTCVDSSIGLLPDDPRAYEGIHSLAIRGMEFAKLDKIKMKAIREWLVTGGQILVMTPLGEQTFQKNARAIADKDNDAFTKAGLHVVGNGIVMSPGKDSTAETIFWRANMESMHVFFEELAEIENDDDTATFSVANSKGLFKSLWSEQATSGQLGTLWLILIVGAYLFVIGPFDFFVTKKLKKPGLTWAIFLVGIIAFSVISYAYTNFINIGEMRTVMAQIVDVDTERGIARGNGMLWVYSAKNSTYELSPDMENVHLSGYESAQGVGRLAAVDIANGKNSNIKTRIPIFSSKDFDMSWYMDWPHDFSIKRDGKTLTIDEPDELNISSVCLVSEQKVSYLKNVSGKWTTEKAGRKSADDLIGEMNQLASYNHESMPDQTDLEHYVQFLTLQDNKEVENNSWMHGRAYNQLSAKERTLARRSLIKSDHEVLIIFCEPKKNVLQIDIKGGIPLRREMCAIRIVLPKET